MDASKIIAMLKKADPQNNTSMHERMSALKMAQREMDKSGLSFASLGFSMDEAERISNQFSVTTVSESTSSTPIKWFRNTRRQGNTDLKDQQAAELSARKEALRRQAEVIEKAKTYEDKLFWEKRATEEKFEREYRAAEKEQSEQDDKTLTRVYVVISIFLIACVALAIYIANSPTIVIPEGVIYGLAILGCLLMLPVAYFVFWILR